MASLVITNRTSNNVVISGDAGVPRVTVSPQVGSTATVPMDQVVGNVQFCDELSAYITAGTVSATIGGVTQTAARILAYKDGDMSQSVYDSDSDGTVDTSDAVKDRLVQVVITATGGSSGATAGTISVQVNDLDGNAITRAVNLRLDISDTNMAGPLDAAGTCQFGAASTGTLVVGSGTASAIVTTDATGLYEGALSNAADETNYFSASTATGGFAAAANSCVVGDCAVASATWSA